MFSRESALLQTSGQVHAAIEVIEQNRIRYLRFGQNGGWQGAKSLAHPKELIFPYQRAFRTLVTALSPRQRFLSLGVGIGTALHSVRNQFPDCELYGVEIDETVVSVAIEYFDSLPHSDVNYWIGDGVSFLCNVDLTFDLLFVDAYMRNQVYSACLEPAFATVLDAAITDDGIVACNLIAGSPPGGSVKRFLEAAKEIFPEVWLLPVGIPFSEQNTLAVFAKRPGRLAAWPERIKESSDLSWLQRMSWPTRLSEYQ